MLIKSCIRMNSASSITNLITMSDSTPDAMIGSVPNLANNPNITKTPPISCPYVMRYAPAPLNVPVINCRAS